MGEIALDGYFSKKLSYVICLGSQTIKHYIDYSQTEKILGGK